MIHRRAFLAAGGSVLAASALPGSASAQPLPLRAAARDMALYGLPLIENATVRQRGAGTGARRNAFRHNRELTTPKQQNVTAPNNDTLYSSAWLDLSRGPVKAIIPPMGKRYFSLALMDMYTNNFAVLGTRTIGGDGGEFLIAGPRGPAPPGAIRSPADWVWALGRTLVDGPADLPAVHAVQDKLQLEGPEGRPVMRVATREAAWPEYFAAVQALIQESPPPATDTLLFRQTAALGITPAGGFDARRFSEAEGREIAAGLADARELAKGGDASGSLTSGWIVPRPNLGDYGQDYRFRAQIALSGLAALPPEEAMYLRPVGPNGSSQLDSRKAWRFRVPAGGLPVDAFWSLTCYETTPAGQAFLFENPIERYSIGDRTPGLQKRADGSMDILISAKDPGGAARANWLPAPTSGRPMILSLRLYLPRPELLTGRFRLPPLTQA